MRYVVACGGCLCVWIAGTEWAWCLDCVAVSEWSVRRQCVCVAVPEWSEHCVCVAVPEWSEHPQCVCRSPWMVRTSVFVSQSLNGQNIHNVCVSQSLNGQNIYNLFVSQSLNGQNIHNVCVAVPEWSEHLCLCRSPWMVRTSTMCVCRSPWMVRTSVFVSQSLNGRFVCNVCVSRSLNGQNICVCVAVPEWSEHLQWLLHAADWLLKAAVAQHQVQQWQESRLHQPWSSQQRQRTHVSTRTSSRLRRWWVISRWSSS